MLVTLLGVNSNKTTLAGTIKYTYDALGQLIQENNHIYTYDRAGNRTSVQTDDRREIYSYDRGRLRNRTVERQQDPAGSQTYTYRYDAQGNTLSDGENTYLYDCLNRITEVKTKAGDIQKKMKLVNISAISADTNCLPPTVSGQGRIITMHVMRCWMP